MRRIFHNTLCPNGSLLQSLQAASDPAHLAPYVFATGKHQFRPRPVHSPRNQGGNHFNSLRLSTCEGEKSKDDLAANCCRRRARRQMLPQMPAEDTSHNGGRDSALRPCLCRGVMLLHRLGGWQVISWALVLALPVMATVELTGRTAAWTVWTPRPSGPNSPHRSEGGDECKRMLPVHRKVSAFSRSVPWVFTA